MALVGSPSSVLSRGIGSWGSVNLLVTRGFGVSTPLAVSATISDSIDYGFVQADDVKYTFNNADTVNYGFSQDDQITFP